MLISPPNVVWSTFADGDLLGIFSLSSVNASSVPCMLRFTFGLFQIAVLSPAPVSRITPPQAPEMMGREKC